MPKIASVEWAKISVDNQEYGQVLLVGEEVIEREEEYNRLAKEGKKMNALIHTTC